MNAATTTAVDSSAPSSSTFGSVVTFTATVTSPNGGTPTGTVDFFDASTYTYLGSCTLDGNGQAALEFDSLVAGSHTIIAVYNGDDTFGGSYGDVVQIVHADVYNDAYIVDEGDTLYAPSVLDNDLSGSPIFAQLVGDVSHGVLSFNTDGTFSYSPDAGFNGEDSFTYQAVDASGEASDVALVTINVNAVSETLIANDDTFALDEDAELLAGSVLMNDDDGLGGSAGDNPLITARLVADVAHGYLVFNSDGTFSYTPESDYNGPDSFMYQAVDSTGAVSHPATVILNIAAVNDAPSVYLPSAASTYDGTDIDFGLDASTQIQIADIDANNESMTLTLTVTEGLLAFRDVPTGVLVTGEYSSSLSLEGTLGALNAALNLLYFRATLGFSDQISFRAIVNDNANTGEGGPLFDDETFPISLLALAPNAITGPSVAPGNTVYKGVAELPAGLGLNGLAKNAKGDPDFKISYKVFDKQGNDVTNTYKYNNAPFSFTTDSRLLKDGSGIEFNIISPNDALQVEYWMDYKEIGKQVYSKTASLKVSVVQIKKTDDHKVKLDRALEVRLAAGKATYIIDGNAVDLPWAQAQITDGTKKHSIDVGFDFELIPPDADKQAADKITVGFIQKAQVKSSAITLSDGTVLTRGVSGKSFIDKRDPAVPQPWYWVYKAPKQLSMSMSVGGVRDGNKDFIGFIDSPSAGILLEFDMKRTAAVTHLINFQLDVGTKLTGDIPQVGWATNDTLYGRVYTLAWTYSLVAETKIIDKKETLVINDMQTKVALPGGENFQLVTSDFMVNYFGLPVYNGNELTRTFTTQK